ncbi:MAG: tetraacyldisaccharide 4'-kinase [Bdellovibrionota bacterium]
MLSFLSWIYLIITGLRNFLYDIALFSAYKSKLPVVSVGNISVGGTGKTPLVIYLCKKLLEQGKQPVVLSRGYKGSIQGPHLVNSENTYEEVGDEPLLIVNSASVPVVIAKKRVAGAKFIESENLGDVIILDDGFQHRALKRDLDIVCIDASSEESVSKFFTDKLIPAGRLRESRSSGFKRANALVLSLRKKTDDTPAYIELAKKKLPSNLPCFVSKISEAKVLKVNDELKPQKIAVFCGIANPEGFRSTLESLGFKIEDFRSFADHYSFNNQDLYELKELAEVLPLVCTEKDLVRLPQELKGKAYTLKTDLQISDDILKLIDINS